MYIADTLSREYLDSKPENTTEKNISLLTAVECEISTMTNIIGISIKYNAMQNDINHS